MGKVLCEYCEEVIEYCGLTSGEEYEAHLVDECSKRKPAYIKVHCDECDEVAYIGTKDGIVGGKVYCIKCVDPTEVE